MKERLREMWEALIESVWMRVLWEIGCVVVITYLLAAILAVPLWGFIMTFLWSNVTYLGALHTAATFLLGICVVMWVIDLAKGVRM